MRRIANFSLSFAIVVAVSIVSGMSYGKEGALPVAFAVDGRPGGMVQGEVLKVDYDLAKVIIKHQEIIGLGMPAMTMVFSVSDKALLDGVQAGAKVKFGVRVTPIGLSVTKIEPEKD